MSFKPGIFIWGTPYDYNVPRLGNDDTKTAMGVALFKLNDGLEYQPFSPEDASNLAKIYRAQGIDFIGWGVARGWSLGEAYQEGRLAGRLAAATGGTYILDLEPYKEDYWQGIPGTPAQFCLGFRDGGGVHLRLCPDARNVGINLEEWLLEDIEAWHPQAYYTAFATSSMAIGINQAIDPLLEAGVPKHKIYPVLPTWYAMPGEPSIEPSELLLAIQYCATQGYAGVALWRRGLMSTAQMDALLTSDDLFAVVVPPEPEPQPPQPTPEPTPVEKAVAAVDKAIAFNEGLRIALEEARETVEAIPSANLTRLFTNLTS